MNRLKYKILFVLVTILLVTIGTNNFLSGYFFKQEYGKAIEKEMYHIGGNVSQQLVRIISLGINIKDIFEFNEICREIITKYPEVSYALVFDHDGNLLYHGGTQRPQHVQLDMTEFNLALGNSMETPIDITVDGNNYYAALVPIQNEVSSVQGAVIIAVSEDYITSKTNKLIYYSVLQSVLFFMVSLFLLVTILSRWVTKPLHKIMVIMTDAGAGNLDARVDISSKDEFGVLGQTLKQMLIKIKELIQSQERATQLQLEYVSEQERTRLSDSLRHAMYTLSSTLDVNKAQQLALENLLSFVHFNRASLWIYENDKLEMKILKEVGGIAAELQMDQFHAYFEQILQDEQSKLSHFNSSDYFVMVIPFHFQRKIIGMVVLEREQTEFERSEGDLALTYISQANIAIANALMYEQMETMAVTDELTGMFNRRYFYQLTEQEFELTRRYKRPMSIVLFDIDHFKQINDQYGHLFGDEVLRHLKEIITEAIQSKHVMARFGGEEFIVLLPNIDGLAAQEVAERMRRKVLEHAFQTDTRSHKITISLGVTELNEEDNIESLLQRVDEALYMAKAEGRNRVILK